MVKPTLVIPTRGIVFARTIETTVLNPEFHGASLLVSGLPIPDSHNECIRRALKTDCTHIWFVEEDMVIPQGALTAMLQYAEGGARYVAVDYPVNAQVNAIQYDQKGKPWFTGFGCTLFDRTLFEKEFTDPWFSTNYDVLIYGDHYELEKRSGTAPVYGKYDIYFGWQCMKADIPITVVPNIRCDHLRSPNIVKGDYNNGVFTITNL